MIIELIKKTHLKEFKSNYDLKKKSSTARNRVALITRIEGFFKGGDRAEHRGRGKGDLKTHVRAKR